MTEEQLHFPDPLGHFETDLTVGDILRRARLQRRLTLEDVEAGIRVSTQHLHAIEQGRLETLPGRVYTLGFIRSYAEFVGLDSDKIISLLKKQSGEKIEPKDIMAEVHSGLEEHSMPTGRVFLILSVVLLVAVTAQKLYRGEMFSRSEQIPSVPSDLKEQTTLLSKPPKTEAIPTTVATAENAPSSVVNPASASSSVSPVTDAAGQVVLRAVENVWLEIRDENRKTVFSRVLQVGEEYWVPQDKTGLVMTLGNAGGLKIVVDGQELPFLGLTGQVIRNISLDYDELKERAGGEKQPATAKVASPPLSTTQTNTTDENHDNGSHDAPPVAAY